LGAGGAVNRARAWAAVEARHGGIPALGVADKILPGVVGIRLDATVTPAHSDKEGAEPNFKGFGHHPLLSYCDKTPKPTPRSRTATNQQVKNKLSPERRVVPPFLRHAVAVLAVSFAVTGEQVSLRAVPVPRRTGGTLHSPRQE
jgi:hypothetical protein